MIFGGLVAFLVILVFGVNEILKHIPTKKASLPSTSIPAAGNNLKIEAPNGTKDTKVQIIDRPPDDPRVITYTEAGFSPNAITIKARDSMGCLISVKNATAKPLHVGVSPHNPAGDPGANYGNIAPNEDGILDVRYTGLTQITLHDHAKPQNQFTVTYGEGCH